MPIGVVCGTRRLMRRFDPERPMRLAYVIGTFSAHPVVMGAMNEFLRWLVEPGTARLYEEMNERCARWAGETNRRLAEADLPLRVVHLATIWTVLFTEPGRYHWLLQYYLRVAGLTLSWVGTGRCLGNMDFTDKDYEELRGKLLDAAHAMKADGWWLSAADHPRRENAMRARLAREVVHPQYVGTVLTIWGVFAIMRFPRDDWYVLPLLETIYYLVGAWLEEAA